jgi:hypothetical protein
VTGLPETFVATTGCDRRPVAELLAKFGYKLSRPDDLGNLILIDDPGSGRGVFAAIAPVPAH